MWKTQAQQRQDVGFFFCSATFSTLGTWWKEAQIASGDSAMFSVDWFMCIPWTASALVPGAEWRYQDVAKGRSLELLIPHPILQGSPEDMKSLRKRNKSHSVFQLKINPLNERKQGRCLISRALRHWLRASPGSDSLASLGPLSHTPLHRKESPVPAPWDHHPGTALHPRTPNLSGIHRPLCTAKQLHPYLLSSPDVWPPGARAEHWAAASNGPQTLTGKKSQI